MTIERTAKISALKGGRIGASVQRSARIIHILAALKAAGNIREN